MCADGLDEAVPLLRAILDDAEGERYERFTHRGAQRTFLVAHAALRLLLSRALECTPREIAFTYGEAGKPSVAGARLHFNMSHSGTLISFAFSYERDLGIDVEEMRPMSDRGDIARRFFHPSEVADIESLKEPEAESAFYRCWTRKEAVSKAMGFGLSVPLERYRVACLPGEPPAVLAVSDGMPPPSAWTVSDLPPHAGFAGAFATPGTLVQLTHRKLDAAMLLQAARDVRVLPAIV